MEVEEQRADQAVRVEGTQHRYIDTSNDPRTYSDEEMDPTPVLQGATAPPSRSSRSGGDSQRQTRFSARQERDESNKSERKLMGFGCLALFIVIVVVIVVVARAESGGSGDESELPPAPTTPAPSNRTSAPQTTTAPAPSNGTSAPSTTNPPPQTPQPAAAGDALLWTDACTPSPFSNLTSTESAKAYLKQRVDQLLSHGPRVAGSNSRGSIEVNRMITAMAQCDGMWTVEHDNFTQNTVIGSRSFSNIVSTFEFGNPELGHLVLSAHWDSKLYTNIYFVGACDSAVPCIQILEIMKVVSAAAKKEKAAKPSLNVSEVLPKITVMFFDGEEAFVDWKGEDNTYGSRHLAQVWEADGRLKTITLFVLLDLLGPANPVFHNYFADQTGNSYLRARDIELTLRSSASSSGRRQAPVAFFPYETTAYSSRIEDDHIPWLNRGVPILHLIPSPFPSVWHRATDNGDAVDYDDTLLLTRIIQNFTLTYRKS